MEQYVPSFAKILIKQNKLTQVKSYLKLRDWKSIGDIDNSFATSSCLRQKLLTSSSVLLCISFFNNSYIPLDISTLQF